jgi:hypothetical protein
LWLSWPSPRGTCRSSSDWWVTAHLCGTGEVYASPVLLRTAMMVPHAVVVKGFPDLPHAHGDQVSGSSIKPKPLGTAASSAFIGVSGRVRIQRACAAAPARQGTRKASRPCKSTIVDESRVRRGVDKTVDKRKVGGQVGPDTARRHPSRGHRVHPAEPPDGQKYERDRVGLHDVGRGTPGMAWPRYALDRSVWRNPHLNRSARCALTKTPKQRPHGVAQLSRIWRPTCGDGRNQGGQSSRIGTTACHARTIRFDSRV